MTPISTALRVGVSRGLIELRQTFSGWALAGQLLWPTVTLVAIFYLRNRGVEDSTVTLGALVLPSVLGMFVAFGPLLTIQYLAADREDGTLLRARAVPNGITAYLLGKLLTVSASVVVYLVILLVPGLFIVDGLELTRPRSWLTLTWVLLLGLVATQTIGFLLGALIASPRGTGYLSVLVLGLVAISGIFSPITALPQWLQWIAQVFPMYWLGLGMRHALLPDSIATVEIGESWRHLETLAALGAWAVVGLLVAPIVLRRMARQESGSRMAERRDKALQRVG
jgi:ABC-2 type transport system permease protein